MQTKDHNIEVQHSSLDRSPGLITNPVSRCLTLTLGSSDDLDFSFDIGFPNTSSVPLSSLESIGRFRREPSFSNLFTADFEVMVY